MERGWLYRTAAWMLILFFGGVFALLFLRYVLKILIPFLVAWIFSYPAFALSKRVSKRSHLPQRLCAAIFFLLFLGASVLLLTLGIGRLLREIRELLIGMVERYGSVEEMVGTWLTDLEETLRAIPLLRQGGERWYGMLYDLLSNAVSAVIGAIPSVAGRILQMLPSLVLGIVITVVAGFYFCMDREGIAASVAFLLPTALRERASSWRERSKRISWRYLRAYLILMLITFSILLVGFLVLKIPYALLLALLCAVVDMLPVLGVGTILIPWAVVLLLQKKFYLGIALLILYAVCALTRQIAEPRLIGKSLGLHPCLTLFATYAGFALFGVIGMLLAPFLALLARSVFLQLSCGVKR